MKALLPLLLALATTLSGWSQTFTFSGTVTFADTGDPAPFFGISAFLSSADPQNVSALTEADGTFEIVFDLDSTHTDSISIFFYNYIDPCSGEFFLGEAFLPVDQTSFSADIQICDDVTPPPSVDTCEAIFTADQQPGTFTVDFQNLSFAQPPIDSVHWDFGDGTTSGDPSPTVSHTYPNQGIYLASLTVFSSASGCSSTQQELVPVVPVDSCNCSPFPLDPVCAVLPSGDTVLYANACLAACAGFDSTAVFDCFDDDCICPAVYDPVAAADTTISDQIQYFNNPCEAECAGYDPTDYFSVDTTGIDCPTSLDQVCVEFNGIVFPVVNECVANWYGFDSTDFVDCLANCICPPDGDPVCVFDSTFLFQFPSACAALCAGFDTTDFVDCTPTCFCPPVFDPVCVTTSQGDTLTFDNLCWAQCFGFDSTDLVTCSGCLCPDIYDPVCVDLGNGNFETFDNACLAACEGFDSTDFVDCDSVFDCSICPTVFDPVCVATGDGQLFLFSNLCFAQCQGFDSTEIFDCSDLPLCFADFSFSTDPNDPLTLTFVDSSFANAQIIEWVWDFGDGSTATGPQVTHTYDQPGNYFVTLTITTADGCTNFNVYHIVVGGGGIFDGPDCSAMFTFEQLPADSTGSGGFTFQFEDLSMGNPDSWQWNFGDGNTSTLQNPVHTYADPGLYWVTLTIQDSACTSEMSILIFAGPDDGSTGDCQALFTAFFAPDSLTVFFLDLSSANTPIVSYAWDFGDGNTSTDQFGWNTYDAAGTYNVTLTITTADGCTSTFELTIDLSDQTMQGRAANQLTSVQQVASSPEKVRLFPNPVRNQLQLEFDMAQAGEAGLSIFGTDGRQLFRRQETLAPGKQRLQIPTSDLPPGMYILQLQRNGKRTIKRFVKQ